MSDMGICLWPEPWRTNFPFRIRSDKPVPSDENEDMDTTTGDVSEEPSRKVPKQKSQRQEPPKPLSEEERAAKKQALDDKRRSKCQLEKQAKADEQMKLAWQKPVDEFREEPVLVGDG